MTARLTGILCCLETDKAAGVRHGYKHNVMQARCDAGLLILGCMRLLMSGTCVQLFCCRAYLGLWWPLASLPVIALPSHGAWLRWPGAIPPVHSSM